MRTVLKIAFMVWVVLWAVFFVRELFIKNNIRDYSILASRTLEGKHAYVTGDKLYDFILLCKKIIPERATYKMVNIDDDAIESRRVSYYLYPRMQSNNPEYIIDMAQFTIKKAGD